jgi:tetratricopeptide (TPR) repeat protein
MAADAVTGGTDMAPYLGDRPFLAADSDRFFGRSTESREVATLWQVSRVTVISGPSGVGKTSLLNAGVIPVIDPVRADVLPIGRISRASSFPLAALPEHNPHTLALLATWSFGEHATRLAGLTVRDFLRKRSVRTDQSGQMIPVLAAIDQAEELLSIGSRHRDRYRVPFIDELAEALDEVPYLHLLLSVRDDYVEDLSLYQSAIGRYDAAAFRLSGLSREAALEAVRKPLEGTGRRFAPGVADALVDILRSCQNANGEARTLLTGDIDPSLLQVVCAGLWAALPDGVHEVTWGDLTRYGDVGSLLAKFLHRALALVAVDHGISVAELGSWLSQTFITELGTRGTAPEGVTLTAGLPNAVPRALRDRHILTAVKRSGLRWYELENDCLIGQVRQIREQAGGEAMSRVRPADFLFAAELALADGDPVLAERHAAEALRNADPKDLRLCAEAQSMLGNVAHFQGKPAEAESRYRTAAALFETLQNTSAVGELLAAIGQSLLTQGRQAEAVDYLHAAVGRVPNDLTVQTELAWALWYAGQQQAAVAVLTSVLAIDGTALDALRARGEILADLGDAKAALRDLDLVQRHQRPSTLAARGLARIMLSEGGATDPEIDAALSRAPDSGPVLLYAARAAALGHDLAIAVDLARRAVNATDPAVPPHQLQQAMQILETATLPSLAVSCRAE